ncbi:DUF3304 domain-containing protein [Burkholderia thailandensis]|uniref:DUF3304 domain-containing protein n=1 Tax=Burkholderia thailandensis TaxID=57975 RepID=A0AAW9CWF7_BURTH|nr:DUF3304 domain-containing protein [Burkholderia thailandensis]MCS3394126.1 DUF3304 domain-containing protein [Burkholderia thailandensis]MCS6429201.1 DUF3304 domain-containing protein [Burkholderia thailandensis]MCS6455676.1 DUF3304 domain-containing protein [Burkholderia thailandensis]MCS6466559.1 DUF3304 domain-containing protein [Burkholderia thailandensis]MCS6485210.1 DUF3304 domain-containing protein [Burkholderia thailandensis]
MNDAKFKRAAVAASCAVFALTACASSDTQSDNPNIGGGQALGMVPINHTDRYAVNIFVDKYWAGDAEPQNAGGKTACCFPGMKDWSKPVTIRWTWGQESNRETKVILKPRESRTVQAYFPAQGPHSDPDWHKTDAYLCIILRDLNTAEVAFSPSGTGCRMK